MFRSTIYFFFFCLILFKVETAAILVFSGGYALFELNNFVSWHLRRREEKAESDEFVEQFKKSRQQKRPDSFKNN